MIMLDYRKTKEHTCTCTLYMAHVHVLGCITHMYTYWAVLHTCTCIGLHYTHVHVLDCITHMYVYWTALHTCTCTCICTQPYCTHVLLLCVYKNRAQHRNCIALEI